VWKTLGNPIVNVSSRLGSVDYGDRRMIGLNNIELITDRPLEVNLREIAEVKKRYPKHAVIVSLMFETREEWKEIIGAAEDTGCDGLELNFGCPHGMCERGMGSAVGQEPKVLEELVRWVMEYAHGARDRQADAQRRPHRGSGLRACGGAERGRLDQHDQSVIGVDPRRLVPLPRVASASSHGGYCGPAVKPIALRMVGVLARDRAHHRFRSAASAASRIGATRPNSWRWARRTCRCARRSCTTATASSRT
jgi:dihydropyrimidine dehydrogenase (NAD+) subunit PreA